MSHWARGDGLQMLLVLLGVILLTRAVGAIGEVLTARVDASTPGQQGDAASEIVKHRHSVVQVLVWLTNVLLICIAVVRMTELAGFSITGLVAPATVLGVALGFGAQRIVQDLLAGFFIIAERQYGYGDVVRVATLGSQTGVTGTVEEISLRITRMRSADGEVIVVPNGQLVQVTNLSRDWARAVVDVPLSADVDLGEAGRVLREVCASVWKDPATAQLLFDEPVVSGVEDLTASQLNVRVVARTRPSAQGEVTRALRARVLAALQSNRLSHATVSTASDGPLLVDADHGVR
jgi:small-conductance mechanosensitive channel